MPDCEWLTSTVPSRRWASSDRAFTVAHGHLLFVADPFDTFKVYKDATFSMMQPT